MNTSYYEVLQVAPDANVVEIEAAYEKLYNKWRRLVTHHDPTVVNEANQSLQTLEQIRTVLVDPEKRAVYDAGIGVGGVISGLADPEAIVRRATPPPRPQKTPRSETAGSTRVDVWECPNCQHVNPVGTHFCAQCGNVLGRACPSCGGLIQATSPFCSNCGTGMEEAIRQRELEEQQEAVRRRQDQERAAMLEPVRKQAEEAWRLTKIGCVAGFFFTLAGIPFWLIALQKARKALILPQVLGDTEYRAQAKKAQLVSAIPLVVLALAACAGLAAGLLGALGNM